MIYTYKQTTGVSGGGIGQDVELSISGQSTSPVASGILIPYSGISDLSDININTPGMTLPGDEVETSNNVVFQANNSSISDIDTEAGLVTAIEDVADNLGYVPEFIVTQVTAPTFSWTLENVILFIGDTSQLPWISITYPDTISPTFDNSWQYCWWFKRICWPLTYYSMTSKISKIICP